MVYHEFFAVFHDNSESRCVSTNFYVSRVRKMWIKKAAMTDLKTVPTLGATTSLEADLLRYAVEQYGVVADNPFSKGTCRALRTPENKWFALFLTAPGRAFGLDAGSVRVMNVKCDPMILDGLVCAGVPGVHRAWHMNHEKWASIEMSGPTSLDLAQDMLDASWKLVMGMHASGRY